MITKNKLCYLATYFFISMLIVNCNTERKISISQSINNFQKDTLRKLSSFNGDSIAYINYFIEKKQNYIGKPLSAFLNDLDLSVMGFSIAKSFKKSDSPGIDLFLENAVSAMNKGDRVADPSLTITITWQKVQPIDILLQIYSANKRDDLEMHTWSNYAKDYFEKIEIGDIYIPFYLKR